MQLDTIQLFCDIATQGSISGGARLHGVTQSAASQRISALERELNAQLIDRGTRPLQLTAAGELCRQGGREILDRFEQLKQQIAQPLEVIRGSVRVAAIYSAGIDLLSRAEEWFEAEHPQARVKVDYLQPALVYERVRDQQVDFGILSYPQKWPDLVAQPLRQERMVVVCKPDHPLAGREELSPADLIQQPMAGFDSSLPIAGQIASYMRRNGGNASLSHSFDNIDTIKAYIGHSDELAILPHRAVAREVGDGVLAAIRLEPAVTRPVAMVTSPHKPRTAAARALMDALVADTLQAPDGVPSALTT